MHQIQVKSGVPFEYNLVLWTKLCLIDYTAFVKTYLNCGGTNILYIFSIVAKSPNGQYIDVVDRVLNEQSWEYKDDFMIALANEK